MSRMFKGDKGDKGAKGDRGPQGVGIFDVKINTDGELIVSLTQGAPANAGNVIGPRGPQGIQGPAGPQGSRGDTGLPFTYQQFTPEQLGGLTGPQGEQGPQGSRGDTGLPFTYQQFTPEQLGGLTGPQGEQGPQGVQGDKGDTGDQGVQGDKGDTGDQGVQGIQGVQGEGIIIKGTLGSEDELPMPDLEKETSPKIGDIYIIGLNGFVWDGTEWDDIGEIRGPQGFPGVVQKINGISVADVILTTDNIEEGADNLYYTTERFDEQLLTKTTTDLTEGTNLYYTTERFDEQLLTKTTTDLTEGTNLYYTDNRAAEEFDIQFIARTTDDLAEGADNLYYTDTRVRNSIDAIDTGGDGAFSYDNLTGEFTYTGPSAAETRVHFSVDVIKNTRADDTEQLVGNLEYNSEEGKFTYTCPTTEDLRSLIAVDRNSTLIINDSGVFSTNSSALTNQVRIGANAGNGSPINTDPAVSIGLNAGQNKQIKNTIVINALQEPLNTPDTNLTGNGLYIKPIRSVDDVPGDERFPTKLQYNPGTGEIFYANDSDFLDQGLRTTDNVQFGSVKLKDYTKVPASKLGEGTIAYNITAKKPVFYDGTSWYYFDGTAV